MRSTISRRNDSIPIRGSSQEESEVINLRRRSQKPGTPTQIWVLFLTCRAAQSSVRTDQAVMSSCVIRDETGRLLTRRHYGLVFTRVTIPLFWRGYSFFSIYNLQHIKLVFTRVTIPLFWHGCSFFSMYNLQHIKLIQDNVLLSSCITKIILFSLFEKLRWRSKA